MATVLGGLGTLYAQRYVRAPMSKIRAIEDAVNLLKAKVPGLIESTRPAMVRPGSSLLKAQAQTEWGPRGPMSIIVNPKLIDENDPVRTARLIFHEMAHPEIEKLPDLQLKSLAMRARQLMPPSEFRTLSGGTIFDDPDYRKGRDLLEEIATRFSEWDVAKRLAAQ